MTDEPAGAAGVFDRAADTYDAVGVDWFVPIAGGLIDALEPAPGERALDIGCGRGAALFPLAAAVGPSGHVLGIDLSPRMIAATKADAADLPQVELRVADASAPGLPTSSFDLIASSLVLFFMPDPAAAAAAWAELLLPGGQARRGHLRCAGSRGGRPSTSCSSRTCRRGCSTPAPRERTALSPPTQGVEDPASRRRAHRRAHGAVRGLARLQESRTLARFFVVARPARDVGIGTRGRARSSAGRCLQPSRRISVQDRKHHVHARGPVHARPSPPLRRSFASHIAPSDPFAL